jgi:hypothetical protein
MRDRVEVCSLSRGVILPVLAQLLSSPLQGGLRFFHFLVPTPPSAALAGRFPLRERYGLTMFRPNARVG